MVIRLEFVMAALGPVYPKQQTISGPGRDFAFGPQSDITVGAVATSCPGWWCNCQNQSRSRTSARSLSPEIVRFGGERDRCATAPGGLKLSGPARVLIAANSASSSMGKPLDIIIPENLRKRHWDGYEETVRTGKTRYGAGDLLAVPALRKDGTRISVEFTIVPFRDRRGRILGIAATLRDVTKQFEEMKVLRKEATRRATPE